MAWRIDQAVTRGEIDNSIEGCTTGQIWLADRAEPLTLKLVGDCWRDLAGTRLRFENRGAQAMPDLAALRAEQTGLVGDMTASRKSKVVTVDEAVSHRSYHKPSEILHEWRNTLYLEWFSDTNGRVIIESSSFLMTISPYEWSMDEDAEEAQKLANLHAMRDFMAQLIRRPEATRGAPPAELDEFAWEERLQESDRLTDAYQEVLEKYIDDSDSERKEAFVMGWDGLLDALADRDESDVSYPSALDLDDSGDEFLEDHPLQVEAQELAMRAMDVVQQNSKPGTPAYQLVSCLLQVSGKLEGALNGDSHESESESGYVLAILKRCLNWLNEAVGACQQLMAEENDPDHLAALAHLRCSAFAIREGIVELRRELK